MGADAEHHAACLPLYLLQQYGKGRNEPKDTTVFDGTFRYRSNAEYLYALGIGGCGQRAEPDGRIGECNIGIGEDMRRSAGVAENDSSNLNKKMVCALFRQGVFSL